jgi:hypothetical protein
MAVSMPGGGGISAGLFTLGGAAAGLPGSSPNHGLNPELVAGGGEVGSVDAAEGVAESVAPGATVEDVEDVGDVDEGAVVDVLDDVVEDELAGAVAEFADEFVEDVGEGVVEEEVVEEEVVVGANGEPALAPLMDVESSQNPGLEIDMVAATANRKLYLLIPKILLVEFVFIGCIK